MKSNWELFALLVATILFAAGCGIPFDIETPTKTIELPNTFGAYFDKASQLRRLQRSISTSPSGSRASLEYFKAIPSA